MARGLLARGRMTHVKLESASWSALFFGAALGSSALGLGVLRGASADAARGLFFVFLTIAIAVLVRRARIETEQSARGPRVKRAAALRHRAAQ